MPYITQQERLRFAPTLASLDTLICNKCTPGELNYMITKLIHSYIRNKGINYTNLNDIMGVMSSAQAEFYRKMVVPYEQGKEADNGKV